METLKMAKKNPQKSLKPRKSISLKQKMRVITLSDQKKRTCEIVEQTGYTESTIRGIVKRRDAIIKAFELLQNRSRPNQTRLRDEKMLKMEDLLYTWILDCNDKNIEIDGVIVQSKAIKFIKDLYKT